MIMKNERRLLCLGHRLKRKGQVDPLVLAFMFTEMHFRGPFFRLCEVICAIAVIYGLRREPRLTLGTCQVSFSYWRGYVGSNNFALLRATFCDIANYEVCSSYLRQNICATLEDTVIRYSGRPSRLYVHLFFRYLMLARMITRAHRHAWA